MIENCETYNQTIEDGCDKCIKGSIYIKKINTCLPVDKKIPNCYKYSSSLSCQ